MFASCRFPRFSFTILAMLTGHVTRSQQYTSQEIGIGVVSQASADYQENTCYVRPMHLFAGPQGRYTYNLSPKPGDRRSVGYLPDHQTTSVGDNGHELLVLGGEKAGWRGRRFGVYGNRAEYFVVISWVDSVQTRSGNAIAGILGATDQLHTRLRRRLRVVSTQRTVVRLDVPQTLPGPLFQRLTQHFTCSEKGNPRQLLCKHRAVLILACR
jgi:hypothetical protein